VNGSRSTLAYLRELTGRDELTAQVSDPVATAVWCAELLRSMLLRIPGGLTRGDVWHLSLSARDELLAAVYESCFGSRVECRMHCAGCEEVIALEITLADVRAEVARMVASREAVTARPTAVDETSFVTASGVTFRLPTVEDQLALSAGTAAAAADALLSRCVAGAAQDAPFDAATREQIDAAMEIAGPLLDVEVELRCASCHTCHPTRLEIGEHLARTVAREQEVLMREVHLLASAYGWSLDAILDLPRSHRHRLVALVQGASNSTRRSL
jgi:hypothetical protein